MGLSEYVRLEHNDASLRGSHTHKYIHFGMPYYIQPQQYHTQWHIVQSQACEVIHKITPTEEDGERAGRRAGGQTNGGEDNDVIEDQI